MDICEKRTSRLKEKNRYDTKRGKFKIPTQGIVRRLFADCFVAQ